METEKLIRNVLLKYELISETENLEICRMGGLTNQNFQVNTESNTFALRFAGDGTQKIIDRSAEEIIVNAIKDKNIDAPLVVFDHKTGIKICEYIDGAQTMNSTLIQSDNRIDQVAEIFKRLHTECPEIDVVFDIKSMIVRYETVLKDSNALLPLDYETVRAETIAIISSTHETHKVLCHNDPLPENFIVNASDEMFLVDWEYGGMNSRYWDLADISIEANYNRAMDQRLLNHYFDRPISTDELREFELNKISIDFLWSLWGFIRHADNDENVDFDFMTYAMDRYNRLKDTIKSFQEQFNS